MKKNLEGAIICPHCNSVLDKTTLYTHDCLCYICDSFIDIDEEISKGNIWGQDDYIDFYNEMEDNYYDYILEEEKDSDENMTPLLENNEIEKTTNKTFVFRFMTELDYNTLISSFESLDGKIDLIFLETCGPLQEYINTDSGKKLAKGLNINTEKIDEYHLIVTFDIKDDDSKKILISTIMQAFPLCIVREEFSNFVMANNKGLAKGLADYCNEDDIQILSMFLTGFEKYKILCNFLYWSSDEYKKLSANDIMVKWMNNSLITLNTMRQIKAVPYEWQTFLNSEEGIVVSKSDDDSGEYITYEEMLEDVILYAMKSRKVSEDEDIIQLISLRGMGNFDIANLKEEDSNAKSEKK